MGYLKKDRLPAVVVIACRALARDKHVLAAHYVPARKMPRHVWLKHTARVVLGWKIVVL
jgi:hypothetical protein